MPLCSPPLTRFSELRDCSDIHCWVVHDGKIIDYSTKVLAGASLYGTDELVYVPFAMPLQKKVFEVLRMRHRDQMATLRAIPEWSAHKAHMEAMWDNRAGFCQKKAIRYYKAHHKHGAKLVIGSLGFRQTDGAVFYEYG